MLGKKSLIFVLAAFALSLQANAAAPANLTAEQVVEKNIAARGGLQAWRAVQTLEMTGKMQAGGNNRSTLAMPAIRNGHQMPAPRPAEEVELPFTMELKRPRKLRFELQFRGQTAYQIYDGSNGWKLRPFLNRMEVETYTAEELKAAATQSELDGPLVDYAAKGTKVELVGIEKVEGQDTYKLQLTLKSGQVIHLWVDANSFLETKIEGNPRRLDGKMHPVEVYYRDYRKVGDLVLPYTLETRVLDVMTTPGARKGQAVSEKISIDKIDVNKKLDDALFSRAQLDSIVSGKPMAKPAEYPVPAGR